LNRLSAPGRSCLVRCRVRVDGSSSPSQALFVRTFRDDRGAELFQAMARLRGQADLADRVAEPLAHEASRHLLVQSQLPGRPLADSLSDPQLPSWLSSTARALAAVHRVSADEKGGRTAEGELTSLTRAGRRLLSVLPPALAGFEVVLARLVATCPGSSSTHLIHGDFSAGQVLVDGPRMGLIDFERLSAGDPLIDLGSFLARLESEADASALSPEWVGRSAAQFLDTYLELADVDVNPAAVKWHRRVALSRLAIHAVRHLKPGWPDRALRFVERAAAIVD